MPNINFPSNPQLNQEFAAGLRRWKWNGTYWQSISPDNAVGYTGSAGTNGYTGSAGYLVNFTNNLPTAILADNPLAYWKFDESTGTSIINYGTLGTAANLTLSGSWQLGASKIIPSDDVGYAYLASTPSYAATTSTIFGAMPYTGDRTIEFVMFPNFDGTNPNFAITLSAVGETLATNYQTSISLTTEGEIQDFWEYGAGTNVTVGSNLFVGASKPQHICVVKNSTAKTVTFYINGIKGSVITYVNEPAGGTSGSIRIGANPTEAATAPFAIAHMAVYNTLLTDDKILDRAKAAGLYTSGYVFAQTITGLTGYSGSVGYTGSVGESSFVFSDTPPVNPQPGDRWYDTTLGFEFVWVNDGDSGQWVEITTSGAGLTGFTGSVGFVGSQGPAGGYTGSAGASGFTGSTGAGGITYPVINSGASSYTIAGSTNPTLTLIKGFTYYFTISSTGHPFWIKTLQVTGTGSAYTSGVTNNGVDSGTVTFTVPWDAPSTLYYICQFHSAMTGVLNIVNSPVGYTGSGSLTLAASVSNAVAITVATTTPTAIASTTLTTTGRKVLLIASGDGNPNQSGGWHQIQLYRDGTAIGKVVYNENPGALSNNAPFAITHLDQPSAGTYTYSVRAFQGSGSFTYGETGDGQAPTIVAVELPT